MATASDHFFSRFAQAEVHTRNLPHWAANSTIIFITYRLADSMSADKLRQWQGERDEWLRLHPEPWDATTAGEYYDTFPAKLDAWLDAGYGSCILSREDCRRIVVENLLHFNGVRYRLHAFVVMPNHVHVLLEIANRDDLPKIVHGWKSYTAKRMNEAIGGNGSVWQREYYDRLVRNAEHYARTVEYIRKNGRVAEEIGRTGSPSRTGCQPVHSPCNALAARCTTPPSRTGCQPVHVPNGQAARCTTPSRTGCQPVRPSPANGQAARCTTVGSPSRTGCQPVHSPSNALAARCTGSAFYYDFPEAMATASDHFFSRFAQAEVHTRNLPHWAANSTIIFITYRLADSMSADKLRQWQGERDEWLRLHPESWDATTSSEYYDTFPAKLDEWLDAGYGSCILAREDCRRIVVENLLHFNGARYRLHAFVVMPNHVHVLVEIANRDDLPKIVHGWKSYTAKRMNEAIGGSGSVWQREYYDRLVRNAEHYARTVEYIRKNGRVAEEIGRTGSPSRTGCQPVHPPSNGQAARCTTPPSRTGCQPVHVPNGQAARCTTPSRTGCQPVQKKDLKGTKR